MSTMNKEFAKYYKNHELSNALFNEICEKGHFEAAKYFYKIANIQVQTKHLIIACKFNRLNILKWLLNLKIDVDYNTLLYYACIYNNLKIAKWLVKNTDCGRISSVFYSVAQISDLKILSWLYHILPDLDISLNNDMVFLHACGNKRFKMIKWLLRIKPNINCTDGYKNACFSENFDILEFLLKQRPDLINTDIDFIISPRTIRWLIKMNPLMNLKFEN